MTHTSPCVELIWTVLATNLLAYLVLHLYHFDRFRCLRLWEGNSGAFKKVMTISYLLAVPLILARSLAMAVIKYKEGYSFIPAVGIVPTPWQLWSPANQAWIFPAHICFALAWAFEHVSHLEELCFWLFLTRTSPLHMSWFGSINFWIWIIGSGASLAVMPTVAVITRADPLKNEAWIALAGAAFSTLITIPFFRVLWVFPGFLRRVKTEGAGQDVVTRLVTFHQLNIIRVGFRLFFTCPMLILGIDGVMHHHDVNESAFWTDLLAVSAGIGCMVSSILTLLIFFPRSMPREAGYGSGYRSASRYETRSAEANKSFFTSPVVDSGNPFASNPDMGTGKVETIIEYKNSLWELEEGPSGSLEPPQQQQPVQVRYPPKMPKMEKRTKKRPTNISPLILNYRSPIDVMDDNIRLVSGQPHPGWI